MHSHISIEIPEKSNPAQIFDFEKSPQSGSSREDRGLGKKRVVTPAASTTRVKDARERRIWRLFHNAKVRRWELVRNGNFSEFSDVLQNHSAFKCRTSAGFDATVGISVRRGRESQNSSDRANFAGALRCGSVWGCPLCARTILHKHAEKINIGIDFAGEQGMGMIFYTLTIPHAKSDNPAELMKKLTIAKTLFAKGGARTRLEKKFNKIGSITRLEITDGKNGIHPHFHTLVFFENELDELTAQKYIDFLAAAWLRACSDLRVGLVTDQNLNDFLRHGFHGEQIFLKNADNITKYMTKMGFSKELTNATDTKKSKKSGRSMWEVLQGFVKKDKADTRKWLEFLREFRRRPAVRWSAGLKKKLGVDDDDFDEPDLVNGDESDASERIYTIFQYNLVVRNGLWFPILRGVETKNFQLLQNIANKYGVEFTSQKEGWPSITRHTHTQPRHGPASPKQSDASEFLERTRWQ